MVVKIAKMQHQVTKNHVSDVVDMFVVPSRAPPPRVVAAVSALGVRAVVGRGTGKRVGRRVRASNSASARLQPNCGTKTTHFVNDEE